MTIEERAKEYYPKGIGVFTPEGAELLQKAYIKGATEQKAIDIDKAHKAFDKSCGWLSVYPWYEAVRDEFTKGMEE